MSKCDEGGYHHFEVESWITDLRWALNLICFPCQACFGCCLSDGTALASQYQFRSSNHGGQGDERECVKCGLTRNEISALESSATSNTNHSHSPYTIQQQQDQQQFTYPPPSNEV